jgi:hypothetical protein
LHGAKLKTKSLEKMGKWTKKNETPFTTKSLESVLKEILEVCGEVSYPKSFRRFEFHVQSGLRRPKLKLVHTGKGFIVKVRMAKGCTGSTLGRDLHWKIVNVNNGWGGEVGRYLVMHDYPDLILKEKPKPKDRMQESHDVAVNHVKRIKKELKSLEKDIERKKKSQKKWEKTVKEYKRKLAYRPKAKAAKEKKAADEKAFMSRLKEKTKSLESGSDEKV